MKIDLTCPVEAWKVTLPTAEKPSCDVTLFNLSALPVTSAEVTITLSSADGEESARITHRGRSLAGTPGNTFHMSVPVSQRIRAEVYEITIDKVWFDNSSVWRREKDAMTEFEPNNLHRSSQLTTLRAIAGDMASGYPVQQKGLWVCVCGRPNPDAESSCIRCHRCKEEVFARYSQEAVEAIVQARDEELTAKGKEALARAAEDTDSRGRDRVHRKKDRRGLAWLAAGLVAVLALLYGGGHHLLPYLKYDAAVKAMEASVTAEDYVRAEASFAALSGYRDADVRAEKCRFAQAKKLLGIEKEDEAIADTIAEENIVAARELFRSLQASEQEATADERETLPAWIIRCDKAQAQIMMAQGRLDEAEAVYQALDDENAREQRKEITYRRAETALNEGKWSEANRMFTELGDYRDSQVRIRDTVYDEGVQAMENGDTEKGLTLLASVSGHRDANERILRHHYERGVALRAEGKIDEAAEAFYLAIGYEDAADQANECFYVPASVAYETFDYERAAQLFGRIPDYRDAREKWETSILKAADKAIGEVRYADAAELLRQLPAENTEGAAMLLDCTYYPAKNAYVRGDYADAIEGFTAVITHRDSAEMLKKAQYALADEFRAAGKEKEAAELYTALGDYEGSADRLKAIRYAQTELLLNAGDENSLNEAIRAYTELGDYENSVDRLRDAQYALAGVLLDKGEHAKAREMYLTLGEYEGVADQLKACDYVQAVQLAADGKAEEARAAFEALGDYADSADRVMRIRYDAAEALIRTDADAAIAAFEALGDYSDSADRANALRYEKAEKLIETDLEAAIAAFKALGEYSDSADRVNGLRYEKAEKLLPTDRDAALAIFRELGDYSDSADRVGAIRYADAEALAAEGRQEEAAAVFEEIRPYGDSASRASAIRYEMAQAYAEAGDWAAARAAYEKMGTEENVDEQINQLRYEAAEEMLKAGQWETAAAAFAAIGSYRDSADRAGQLRYEAAEALIETDWQAAAAAFEALGDYKDSAERVRQIRYDGAEALAAGAMWEEAIAVFETLGDYGNSTERIRQIRYTQASVLAAGGKWDEAVAAFEALGDYADSRSRVTRTRYEQAVSLGKDGEYLDAADIFVSLGSYQDAAKQAENMWDSAYGNVAATVASAREQGNYTHIYLQLRSLDMARLPAKYADLKEMYHEACYQEGERLYREGRPYEAYACYSALPEDYRDVAAVMQRSCYLILGDWKDMQGNVYHFEGNGTCTLNGESLYFLVKGTDVFTGKDVTRMEKTHRLTGVTKKNAWFFDQRSGKEISIYLTRVEK